MGEWPMQRPDPWPAVPGHSIALVAPPHLAIDDPHRIPGGGKITSPVVRVERIADWTGTPA
jgi:hypothetical protein